MAGRTTLSGSGGLSRAGRSGLLQLQSGAHIDRRIIGAGTIPEGPRILGFWKGEHTVSEVTTPVLSRTQSCAHHHEALSTPELWEPGRCRPCPGANSLVISCLGKPGMAH